MKKEITLTLYNDANKQNWDSLLKLKQDWNLNHSSKLENIMDIHMTIGFMEDSVEHLEFMKLLTQRPTDEKYEYDLYNFITYEESDYQNADFIYLSGQRSLEGFIINQDKAFGEPVKCKLCGYIDPWSIPQLDQLVIDENIAEQWQGKKGGFFNLDNGGLLVGKNVIDYFKEYNVKGIVLKEVLNKNNQPSENYFQLQAEKAVVMPGLSQTAITGYICPQCGVVHGQLKSALFFSKGEIKDLGVFSMHPNHCALMYFERKIVDTLKFKNISTFSMERPAYLY